MSKNIIKINRGDSFEFSINIPNKIDTAQKYLLAANEAVYFAILYPHQRFEDAILIKGYTLEDQDKETGEILVKVTPKDTENLLPGIYYYTVKLRRGESLHIIDENIELEEVRTIIERTKFIINE